MRDVLDHPRHFIPAMTADAVDRVRLLEATSAAERPQVHLAVHHFIHAGIYARTVEIPPNGMITGVRMKVDTILVVSGGDVFVYTGSEVRRAQGYHVVPASAPRKSAFFSPTGAHLTMMFATQAKTVEEAEAEFTDEPHMLQSRGSACRA